MSLLVEVRAAVQVATVDKWILSVLMSVARLRGCVSFGIMTREHFMEVGGKVEGVF